MNPLPANWWPDLCAELRRLQASPGYFETAVNRVRNDIVLVDEAGGFVRLRSAQSPTGSTRDITRDMIEWPENTHGVIRRDLRDCALAVSRPAGAP